MKVNEKSFGSGRVATGEKRTFSKDKVFLKGSDVSLAVLLYWLSEVEV